MGSATLYSVLIYMLLSKDVTYASNVFGTYIIVDHDNDVVLANRF